MFNPADAPSRQQLDQQLEWSLSQQIFHQVERQWGQHTVDLFANRHNAKCQQVVTWKFDQLAIATNAMTISWTNLHNPYLCPPWNMIPPHSPETEIGSSQRIHDNHTELDECDLVSPIITTSAKTTSNFNTTQSSTSTTRSVTDAFGEESILATSGMAYSTVDCSTKQRRIDEPSTLNDESTAIIFDPHREQVQTQQYVGPQQRFLDWGKQHNRSVLEFITAIDLINYLTYGYVHRKWAYSTVIQYKQAILLLYTAEQCTLITNDPNFIKFLSALKSEAILSFDFPVIDLQPAINFVLSLGSNQDMALLKLTQKLCFLLGITGFLRPSDIERIDDSKTLVTDENSLRLVIIAPKEKRSGRPIEKVVVISRHATALLCPVACYLEYKERFRSLPPLVRQHTRLTQLSYTELIRNTVDYNKCIAPERISNHIRSILSLATSTSTASSRKKSIKARRKIE